jgi:hypothetical protein
MEDKGTEITKMMDQLCKALGTSRPEFASGLVAQLGTLGKASQEKLSFVASVVVGVQPRDQLEAMLAAQMAAIHNLMFDLSHGFSQATTFSQQIELLSSINKLARTYAVQLEALKRYRSKGEQKVTVQHVTVGEGGQAIVGDIHQQQSETGTLARPHPPAITALNERPMEPIGELPKPAVGAMHKLAK